MNSLFDKLISLPDIEYLTIDGEFKLANLSSGVNTFADKPAQVELGKDARQGFPELVGAEDAIREILIGQRTSFECKGIARILADGTPLYFDLYIFRDQYKKKDQELIVFFEDMTEKMNMEQTVVQATNEAMLLLNSLDEREKKH
ncbi:MAG: hypothetical protein WA865_16655 [Spirulinaceae cyanobacterium]